MRKCSNPPGAQLNLYTTNKELHIQLDSKVLIQWTEGDLRVEIDIYIVINNGLFHVNLRDKIAKSIADIHVDWFTSKYNNHWEKRVRK